MNAFKTKTEKLNIKSIALHTIRVIAYLSFCAFLLYANITDAVALEQEIRCGIEEHTHVDECYDGDLLVCEKPAHMHDGNCYIVLLKENDINEILTLLDRSESHSLEHVITDTMSSALNFNSNMNGAEKTDSGTMVLTQDTVVQLNNTISDEDSLPDIVLNEQINNVQSYALGDEEKEENKGSQQPSQGNNVTLLSIGDNPVTSNNNANFYIYLDGKWTCIGSLPFTTSRSNNRYNSTIQTDALLTFVNGVLGTEYNYNSFDISVASSLNGAYSKQNIGVNSVTTTIGYRQTSANANAVKYVRLIPNNASSASSTGFAFYTVTFEYPDGTNTSRVLRSGTTITMPEGNYEWSDGRNTYAAGETVTITSKKTFTGTTLGPVTYINLNYNINFPTVSGVTISTKPTIAGLSTTEVTDGFTEGSSAVVRNVSQQSVEGKVNNNTTGLSRVIQFKGWKVEDTDIILQPNTTLVWDELLQYATGASVQLTAIWDYNAIQTASFFIRFDSVAVDTDGNITGQDSNKYTDELFSAYVGGIDTSLSVNELHNLYHIADTTSDNSYGANQEIRALYGEKTEGAYLSAFPTDDYVFQSLIKYAQTGYLSVDGVAVKAEDLNDREYAIRWYVFKAQSDAWHIDGKLVRKEGLIHVYKTFAGNKALIAEAKKDFYIDAEDITAGTNTVLNLNNCTSYDASTDTYMWEIDNVDYGELWEITECPHQFNDPSVEVSVYSEYTVMDAHGDQSISGTGTSLSVRGMTYALDEGIDEVLRASFTNIYNKSNSIVIKKQDNLTGMSIGGATFRLLQNGVPLKFNYNSETESYEFDPADGSQVVLSGTANGYFEISIEDFSYDLGNIIVQEVTAPTGYSPIGNIEIGYTDDQKTVGIISGNSEMIRYVEGILIIGNSTDSMSVTAKKAWDCPEYEWQPVTLQLLANGKLATTIITGVVPEVVLSAENNWQYTWENLPVYVNGEKIDWAVKETMIGSETAKADGSFVNWLVSYGIPIQTEDKEGNPHIQVTVTNTTKRVMLRLTKTDMNKSILLQGAGFLLEAVDVNGNVLSGEIAKTATTSDAGTLIFDNLKCNIRYRLTEQSAPDGYLPLTEYIYFSINEDGSVTVEENYYAEAGSTAYNLTVLNAEAIPLPESGGVGDGLHYALGILLIAVAAGIYISNLWKKEVL